MPQKQQRYRLQAAFLIGLATAMTSGAPAHAAGDLTVSVASVDGEDMDPMLFRSAGQHTYYGLVFDPFIAKDPKTGQLSPGLATEWSVGEDGRAWTIKLRRDVKFHDGTPFTAEDAKFSLERYTGKFGKVAAPGSERLAGLISAIEIVDPATIVIRSRAGSPTIPFDLAAEAGAASGYVVPKAYIERVGAEAFNRSPVGTGPFRFESQEAGRRMVFKANRDYWGGAPDAETLTLRIVPELSARVAQLRSGEADIVSGIVGPAIPMVKSTSNLRLVASEKGQLIYVIVGGITNPQSPLSKPEVREAISLAVDRKAIVDRLLFGNGAVASLFGFPFSFGWPADAASYPAPYDPAKAKALLAAAGYKDGFELTLIAATEGRDFAQAIAQYLAAIGVKANLQVREIAQVLAEARSDAGKTQTRLALFFGTTGSGARADFGSLLFTWLLDGQVYTQTYGDPALAKLVAEQGSIADPAERARVLGTILKTAKEKNYILPLYYADSLFAVRGSVTAWQPIPGIGFPSNLASVHLAK